MNKNPEAAQIAPLEIFCYFDKQRFRQFGSMDCANWYGIKVDSGKNKQALYPAMGRKHINFNGTNQLIFNAEPRLHFKSIDYFYVIDGVLLYQFDRFYNQTVFNIDISLGFPIWVATLAVGNVVYSMLTCNQNIFVIKEEDGITTVETVTDANAVGGSQNPGMPLYVNVFGNRFVVSAANTPNYFLSQVDMGGSAGNASNYFTINNAAIFARASGIIGQIAVLHGQMYILCDFVTDVWSNIITQITVGAVTKEFPFKLNTSYNFDYGIADPNSLSVEFGRMVWLARNSAGLVSFVASTGQSPQDISSQAVNVLLENSADPLSPNPFILSDVDGFLYQYENTIFYRVSAGVYNDYGILDVLDDDGAIEYNFATETWSRVIELNGERNRIRKHAYFDNQHIVSVLNDNALYVMAGNIYYNELVNPAQENTQAPDYFLQYPMRYELVTSQIYNPDYSEFMDEYVQIDFVFGNKSFFATNNAFLNATFIVGEQSTDDNPIYMVTEDDTQYMVTEDSNTPVFSDSHYYALFKPHVGLYYSDDGGETFTPTNTPQFSPLGNYQWRMRWYQLGTSRNRCYKLICVSSAPIVILGGVRNTKNISGGAN